MPPPHPGPHRDNREAVTAARGHARQAVIVLARDRGAQPATRPSGTGQAASVPDVAPLDGARAARDIELAARHTAREHIRAAREAGHTWQQIGYALGVTPGGDASQAGESVAEAAYTYAAGPPGSDTWWQPRSLLWRCASCGQVISDHGPIQGPAEDEQGHAEGCPRLAAAAAVWDAGWEAGQ